jgi:hypothetical protein
MDYEWSLIGRLLDLLACFRQRPKRQTSTNNLAYCSTELSTATNIFVVQAPRAVFHNTLF